MFKSVLVANRGAVACRIIKTLRKHKIRAIAVYAESDENSLHVHDADFAISLGEGNASETYLAFDKILKAAKESGAEAIHPGYGFLSENADFAEACTEHGFIFIGPSPKQIRQFGLKNNARNLAKTLKIPLLEGTEILKDSSEALKLAKQIRYPIMLKSTAGGGGIGMQVCHSDQDLLLAFERVTRLAEQSFGLGALYLEKYISKARHIEVQIFGDGRGQVVTLGERDCSVQRRHQKVLEEAPAPHIPEVVRTKLFEAAKELGTQVLYKSAGTVEFLMDAETFDFYFLEVNTRLQVEHGITEEITGIDLVEWMLKEACGELDLTNWQPEFRGVALEARLYAEDPQHLFRPSAGLLTEVSFPEEIRIETWVEKGCEVSPHYDPMLAKIIVKAESRQEAVLKLKEALDQIQIAGIETNLEYLRQITRAPDWCEGLATTNWLEGFSYKPTTIDVLEPGTQTSIQDYPGRTGYWAIGVPPSGPMDDYAFRLANALVSNPEGAAGLEMTLRGPTLKFNHPATIALTGALMEADLDGVDAPYFQTIEVKAGSILTLGNILGAGCRTYLAVGGGGFQVPDYLGSKSTFSLGKFGGHGGRILRHGDTLHLNPDTSRKVASLKSLSAGRWQELIPKYSHHWTIEVLYGPHGAPDFFTEDFIETFFATDWSVHYNSNRLGIRLLGPKPEFSRPDGGEAGLHPSNIHDNEYAIGTINFTGDLPVILAKDGPSLGGFVCPVTIIKAELWKIGQLRPGDKIRFKLTSYDNALEAEKAQDLDVAALSYAYEQRFSPNRLKSQTPTPEKKAILATLPKSAHCPGVVYRQAGDKYILIEYGPPILDLDLRFRVHALMEWFKSYPLEGVIELSPGVRSLQVHFDGRILSRKRLLETLIMAEGELGSVENLEFPTRILKLPLAFNAQTTKEAIAKYQQSVRETAPWLPDNSEFIRRINGLDSIEEVKQKIFSARYMVLGLGDVYLGAPCAVPIDPRHRLVTTKYNPARTWTAEGEVGIGGVYMCIYGMESPGGYQLIGRTVPVWNTYRVTRETEIGKPWLLRFFDQVQFFPMSEEELGNFRREFARGRTQLEIKHDTFKVKDYHEFLKREASSIGQFKALQSEAFEAEKRHWQATETFQQGPSPELDEAEDLTLTTSARDQERIIGASIAGSIWSILVKPGDQVQVGQCVAVIEAMKMEVNVEARAAGIVKSVHVEKGKIVQAGHALMTFTDDI